MEIIIEGAKFLVSLVLLAMAILLWPKLQAGGRTETPSWSAWLPASNLIFSVVLFIWALTSDAPIWVLMNETTDTKYMRLAFKEYGKGNWEGAIRYAKDCVGDELQFNKKATEKEKELIDRGIAVPIEGRCTEEEKLQIDEQQGLVNNVGACYWILGRASQKLGQIEAAREAYSEAEKLTHAVAWDRRIPGFWSVSKDARGRLEDLQDQDAIAQVTLPESGESYLLVMVSDVSCVVVAIVLLLLVVLSFVLLWLLRKPETERGGSEKLHAFLSYCKDNIKEVTKLRDDLLARGEQVWWDAQILPGDDWELAINRAMKQSYAVVLCLSKETQARPTTGIYPEAMQAIDAFQHYEPGSIYLIPVRLSACEIPRFKIGPLQFLDSLEYVDLFPPSKRKKGLERLARALKLARERNVVDQANIKLENKTCAAE